MLTPEEWEVIEKKGASLFDELEIRIIEEIASRIANVGYANTVVMNDVEIAKEMGLAYEEIVVLVAQSVGKSASEIDKIFQTAGLLTLENDNKIYKRAGLTPIELEKSKLVNATIEKRAKDTVETVGKLLQTTAKAVRMEIWNNLNTISTEVNLGVKSYSEAIIETIQGNNGAYVIYPSGVRRSIESAVRTNILTSVQQTCGELQLEMAEEMGCDLMELTAHGGARPEHAEWQGKIVSISGRPEYLSLDDIGYGTVTGFKGANCRHDWMPYFKGLPKTYNQKMLNQLANEKVTYNDIDLTVYQASQVQRKMERNIRTNKKNIAIAQGILKGTDDEETIKSAKELMQKQKQKLKENNSLLNDFIEQTKSKKDYSRLRI